MVKRLRALVRVETAGDVRQRAQVVKVVGLALDAPRGVRRQVERRVAALCVFTQEFQIQLCLAALFSAGLRRRGGRFSTPAHLLQPDVFLVEQPVFFLAVVCFANAAVVAVLHMREDRVKPRFHAVLNQAREILGAFAHWHARGRSAKFSATSAHETSVSPASVTSSVRKMRSSNARMKSHSAPANACDAFSGGGSAAFASGL